MAGCSRATEPLAPAPTSIVSPAPGTDANSAKTIVSDRQKRLTELVSLIRQRLEVMPGVAQAKWNRKLQITDAKREAALLDDIQAKGVAAGLPADLVREFFQAQITAAKLVQEQRFADWQARQLPPFPQAPDLEQEVRPQIDELNRKLLAALGKCRIEQTDRDWPEMLDQTRAAIFQSSSLSRDVVDAALRPLREVSE